MRTHTVLQRGEGGPWHYVSAGRDGAHPIEGCTPECTHATKEEAYEHHRVWLLDNLRRYDAADEQRKCEACGAWTTGRVSDRSGGLGHVLCPEHDARAWVEEHDLPPGTKLDAYTSGGA